MKTGLARLAMRAIGLCMLFVLWPADGVCQIDSLLILEFNPPPKSEAQLRITFSLPNDPYAFRNDLADRLRNSKVRQLHVVCSDEINLDPGILKGYRRGIPAGLERVGNQSRGFRYVLIGRIEIDAQIAKVSGELFEISPAVCRAKLIGSFTSEAQPDKRYEVARGYFVEDVAEQIEAKLDKLIRVLIKPFTYIGKDTASLWLATQVGELLRTRLAISQNIRVLEGRALGGLSLRKLGDEPEDLNKFTLPMSGRREAAKYVIGGSLFECGGVISAEAYHVDVETGQTILTASIPPDSVTGKSFYRQVNSLGDDMRRAIDLHSTFRDSARARTIAVVALPPYPVTAANRKLTLEIAGCIDRKLRLLEGSRFTLPPVTPSGLLDRYVIEPEEEAVMGRAFNTEYLCMVRLERPADRILLTLTVGNARISAGVRVTVGPGVIGDDTLDKGLNGIVEELLQRPELRFTGTGSADIGEKISTIHMPHRPKRIAVVALPPYPETPVNSECAARIVRNVATKLKALQGRNFDMDVSCFENPARNVDAEYVWNIEWVNADNLRSLHMKLWNAENPYDSVHALQETVNHMDHLPAIVDTMTRALLDMGFGGWRPADASQLETMQGIQLALPYKSVQVGLNLVGIIQDSRAVYGNHLRAALEVKAILADFFERRLFLGVAGEWDFGKTRTDNSTIGRYASMVFRYYFSVGRESRMYADVCPALLNVERRAGNVYGQVNFGVIFGGGVQLPLTGGLCVDLNGRVIIPFGETELATAPVEYFKAGKITSLSFGIAVLWRYE